MDNKIKLISQFYKIENVYLIIIHFVNMDYENLSKHITKPITKQIFQLELNKVQRDTTSYHKIFDDDAHSYILTNTQLNIVVHYQKVNAHKNDTI